jgi:uncharacterized protein YndB with AHSA1/START domain
MAGYTPKMADAAVRKATGRGWDEWFEILDRFDVRKHGHRAAAIHLSEAHGVPDWWCQMVTVEYERSRGLREVGETTRGWEAQKQRTLAAPPEAVWAVVADLGAWLEPGAARVTVRSSKPAKVLRLVWEDEAGKSTAEISLTGAKGGKTAVRVQHSGLPDDAARERMKGFWSEAFERLAARVG